MMGLGQKPLRLTWYGPTKVGKSHLAAMFVKKFDGFYLDMAKVQQISSMSKGGSSPKYSVAQVGDAGVAAENVGLTEENYRFIRTWEDFLFAVEEAKSYRDDVSKKINKKIWVVIDDTTNWRWLCAYNAMIQNGHKSLSQPDWSLATMTMSSAFQDLEGNFNVILINQMKDAYENDIATGKKAPSFYPANLDYICDATLSYEIATKEDGSRYPILRIDSMKNIWICSKDRPDSIIFDDPSTIGPEKILEALKYPKELW